MSNAGEPKIGSSKGEDYTSITYYPDLAKFGMETLDKDTVDLFKRRAYDIAACVRGVRIFLNGKKLPVSPLWLHASIYLGWWVVCCSPHGVCWVLKYMFG